MIESPEPFGSGKGGGLKEKKFSDLKHEHNSNFERLLIDAERGRLNPKLSDAFKRPAYYGTSICAKEKRTNVCEQCAWYVRGKGFSKKCSLDYQTRESLGDEVVESLPCWRKYHAEIRDEKDGC